MPNDIKVRESLMAAKNNGQDRSHVIYFQNKHHIHTLKVMASGE
jgi:hypothetical protein